MNIDTDRWQAPPTDLRRELSDARAQVARLESRLRDAEAARDRALQSAREAWQASRVYLRLR